MAETASQIFSIEDTGGLQDAAAAPAPFVPPPVRPAVGIPDKYNDVDKSHWPKTIAIIAAATGNFGPLIQYTEQKRKTKVYNAASSLLHDTYAKMNKGQTDEAIEQFQVGMSQLGGRAPELSQFLQPFISQLSNIQQNKRDKESLVQMLGAQATAMDLENNPAMAKIYKNVAKVLKDTTVPMDSKFMQDFVNKHTQGAVHLLPNENAIVRSFVTGEDIVSPLKTGFRREDISDFQAANVARELNLTVPDVVNIMNDKSPELAVKREALQATLSRAKTEEQNIGIAARSPTSSEYNAEAQKHMSSRYGALEGTRMLATGNVSPEDRRTIQDNTEQVFYNRANASMRGELRENFLATKRAGLAAVNIHTGATTYPTPMEAVQNPNIALVDDLGVNQKVIQPTVEQISGLRFIDEMFERYGDANRIEVGLGRLVSERFGIAVADDLAPAKAAEAVASRIIEQVGANLGLTHDSVEMRDLKRYVIGKFASKEAARDARIVLHKRLEERLNVYLNKNQKRYDELPPSYKQQANPKPGQQSSGTTSGPITATPTNIPAGTLGAPATPQTTSTGIVKVPRR